MSRLLLAALSCVLALPAAAQTLTLKNPLQRPRFEALVGVPGDFARIHSVVVRGELVPAQYIAAEHRLVFTVSLGPEEVLDARLSAKVVPASQKRVAVTLEVQDGGTLQEGAIKGGVFHQRTSFTPPPSHFIHDGLIAFEGIGWESDRVAYRLYLDERNVPDLFGKFGPDIIFPHIGRGFDDYQYPRDWGGDIYKVGDALGMGGLGVLREGKAAQLGRSRITGKVIAQGPITAIAAVDAEGVRGTGASLNARYAISAGSALTFVDADARGFSNPLVAGLTLHATDEEVPGSASGPWRYIALWGPQEHGEDHIGTALFYRAEDVEAAPQRDGASLFIRFKNRDRISYAFAGRWVQEGKAVPGYKGIRDLAGFRGWLEETREDLGHPIEIQFKK